MGLFRKSQPPPAAKSLGSESSESSASFPGKSRTLEVRYDSWKARHAQVTDLATGAVVYEIDSRCRRPNVTLRRPGSADDVVGTVKFHPWTRKMEVERNGHVSKIRSKNWKQCDLLFDSPAFGGQTMMWRRKTMWVVLDHILLDENQLPVARFSPNQKFKKLKTLGTIEIMDPDLGQDAVDEIVLTGMAVMDDTIYYTTVNAASA